MIRKEISIGKTIAKSLAVIVASAFILPIIWAPIKYCINYHNAREKAISMFGDKVAPLTEQEERIWYDSMRVGEGRIPSYKQLEDFLKR